MKTKHLLLLITAIAFVSYAIWEYRVYVWAQDEIGALIRVDLLMIYPALLALIAVTAFSYRKDRKRKELN